MRRAVVLCAMAFGPASTLACSQSSNNPAQIAPVGQPPIGGIGDTAQVPVGIVVGFMVEPAGQGSPGEGATASVDDPRVVSLVPTSEPSTFVLIGLAPGQTTLHAALPGYDPATMGVVVAAQTPSP